MYRIDLPCLANLQSVMEKLRPDGKAQYMFTNELFRLSDDYVPFDTGMLKTNAYVDKGGTAIVYDSPYARYMWYGKLMVDPVYGVGAFYNENKGFWSRPGVQKVETERDLNYKGAPRRGAFWVERAFIDNEQTLTQQIADYITRFDEK